MRALISALALVFVAPVVVLLQTDAAQRSYAGRNWPLPGGDLNSTRYSTLSRINTSNIKSLGGAWAAELGQEVTKSALVVQDGVMYLQTQQQLLALDAKTGKTLWAYKPPVPFNGSARGVALSNGLVLAGLSDASVAAIRADTGDPAWTYKGADVSPGNGYISSPPAAGNGVAVVPVSGGDGYL